jgi:hypothetical protein
MTRVALILPILLLVACTSSPSKNQWVLESYDANKGYVFSKDGVHYQAHCYAFDRAYEKTFDPTRFARTESDCAAVTRYMHQPLPDLDGQVRTLPCANVRVEDHPTPCVNLADSGDLIFREGYNSTISFKLERVN